MNEEELRKFYEFYQTVIQYSQSGIVGVDCNGRVIIYNQAASEHLGVPVNEAIGKLITDINESAGIARVLSDQSVQINDLVKVGMRTAVINRAPVYLDGKMIGAISTVRDITKLQQYEELIRRKMVQQGLQAKWFLEDIVAESQPMKRLIQLARRYAEADSTVLIQGESGTGKEMLAQGIHSASRRKHGPFVALNCAALPESLIESELFGYEEGSFTGARRGGKPGLFELAHKGTIFLDEIGELPINLQPRLLRALQEREVMRIGGNKVHPVDVRIIAATNRDLVDQVHAGQFRQDLYFRLAVLVLTIPPLRDRTDDIPRLIESFIHQWTKEKGISDFHVTEDQICRLKAYLWPGNVRELINILERATILSDPGETLRLFDQDIWIVADGSSMEKPNLNKEAKSTENESEESRILRILKDEGGNMGRAAVKLGMHRSTLWRKLKNMQKQE